jgi:hypothetical protein
MLVLFIYTTRLASNEILSPSNKIYRKVGRAKDLSALKYFFAQSKCSYRLLQVSRDKQLHCPTEN